MGLLDDAIREHLELKRKHGAAAEEIAQEEAEALGPARRDFPVEPQPEPAEPALPPDTAEIDPLAKDAPAPTTIDEPELTDEPAVHDEPGLAEEPEVPEFLDEPAESEFADEPEAEPPDPETPSGRDDVLEDTPEFLQDAPEHDRLWFEQKPPRDFDFD